MSPHALVASATLRVEPNLGGDDPAFRRATTNMILATKVGNILLEKVSDVPRADISFVLGTQFGEVHSSLEFLRNLNRLGVASPTAFQNSLHNSTLGFTSIQLGLTGPAFTVSVGTATPSAAHGLALDLLQITPFAFFCLVDSVPTELRKYYVSRFPDFENHEGVARGFLFARAEVASARKLATLEEVELSACLC